MNDLKPLINLKNLQKCVGFLFFNLFGVCAIAGNYLIKLINVTQK